MNEMWNEFFSLRRDKPRTLQLQIRQQLVDAITNGLIRPKEPLPSSRKLAQELKVARNTIIAAYKELEFDNYIVARERQGYFVNDKIYENYSSAEHGSTLTDNPNWLDRLITKKPSFKSNVIKEDWQKYPYSFTIGQLDPTLTPFHEWQKVVKYTSTIQEIKKWNIDSVDHDDPSLIKQIQSKVLPKRGIWANKNQILVTAGSQNAIYILASLLVSQSTTVGIENPGYPDARNIFSFKTDNLQPISVDSEGIVVDEVKPHHDLIYTTPSHQYPTGVTMSMDRRKQLLAKAYANDMVIIEDDYEAEINFQKKPYPSLKSLDTHNNVIYMSSFSKAFAPGLRLGYMVGPEKFITEARALRRLMFRHIPANNQRSVALFIGLGHYHSMFSKIQKVYGERWRLIHEKIKKEEFLSCVPTSGGSTFWVKIPESVNSTELCAELREQGVIIRAGDTTFFEEDPPTNYLYIGFSSINTNRINKGMNIIIEQIRKMAL